MIKNQFNIAFAVSIISQFANNQAQKHIIIIVKYIFLYLKNYPSLKIS